MRCHDVLTELRVRDLAVIADVTLPFQPGLNVLTGETGAGKSMVVDALALLLGERASGDVVRPGADKTIVEGAFEFASAVHRHLLPPFAALGIELEEGRLVLKREVLREGKSRAWVNGSPVTISVLSEIGGLLVDLHGQHETQSLLRADAQRDMLDAYADADVERVAVRDAHARFKELEQREAELTSRQDDVRKKADYLRHVLQEIERAKPKVGEDEALDIESKRLAHAEELGRLARDLEETVDSAGLTKAQKVLAGLLRLDPSLGKWQELLDAAFASSAELAQAARAYAAEIEADPERLTAVEQRRDLLFRLQQKHGPTIADVLAARDSAARELELLDTADLDLRNIAAERATAADEFARATAALTAKRTAGVKKLARAVNKVLPALGMEGGKFAAQLLPRTTHHAHGAEDVVFEVKLNEGLDPRPLARVASGGELSRLMLTLKVVLAAHDVVPTLVFDEVDQGIGGEVGGRVGEALMDVSREGRQALVITHLPQIAVYADQHLVVSKGKKGGIATSDVEVVEGESRVKEVARMLGDADMATARRHAVELLKTASEKSASQSETPSPPARSRPTR
ncbi:MAG TPA: DNA repair protein RecN [Gemmatimonadales bacterium]|nr:DNA repair protein RecN [Gemmatimonadales bacterium]